MTRRRVLFLCTHNSARSQMAEGFLRALAGDRFEVASAGTEARGVNPMAARVMAEVGVDVAAQTSKTLDRFLGASWDYVITVCDSANEACPVFPGATKRLHWSFEDPSAARGTESERLAVFRRVRDEIRSRIATWLAEQLLVASWVTASRLARRGAHQAALLGARTSPSNVPAPLLLPKTALEPTEQEGEIMKIVALADVVERTKIKSAQTHETLKKVSAPTEEAGKPRAQSRNVA